METLLITIIMSIPLIIASILFMGLVMWIYEWITSTDGNYWNNKK